MCFVPRRKTMQRCLTHAFSPPVSAVLSAMWAAMWRGKRLVCVKNATMGLTNDHATGKRHDYEGFPLLKCKSCKWSPSLSNVSMIYIPCSIVQYWMYWYCALKAMHLLIKIYKKRAAGTPEKVTKLCFSSKIEVLDNLFSKHCNLLKLLQSACRVINFLFVEFIQQSNHPP